MMSEPYLGTPFLDVDETLGYVIFKFNFLFLLIYLKINLSLYFY